MWVFADEGVERKDLNDSIDAAGNRAPDGILGPYHEKEGSFYTIREIWAPVQFEPKVITNDFDGNFSVTNRYLYTNLKLCKFSFDLSRFENSFPDFTVVLLSGSITSPDITPGNTGSLNLTLPSDWKKYDVLYITATDLNGMVINTWSWNISKPADLIPRTVKNKEARPSASEKNNILIISTDNTEIAFDKTSGIIMGVKSNGKAISFCNGVRFAGYNATFSEMKHYQQDNSYVVELKYYEGCRATWTIYGGGWMKLDYEYSPSGEFDYAGITFSYPEELVTGATLMANGPYHVWKNRLKGTQFGVYKKKYNNTITGESWDYPEFKGYYSNFYGVQVQTRELPITILSATENLFLHLFTPGSAKYSIRSTGVRGEVNPPFPEGNISFLHGISPIGTKFTRADAEGPQSQKNKYNGETLKGTLYFRFGE
jgi:hypothetical protein